LLVFIACLTLPACSMNARHVAPTVVSREAQMSNIKKITPVLLAEDVDACVAFWNALGLSTTMSFPFEGRTGFAALSGSGGELMYQSFALSRAQDANAIAGVQRAVIYLDVGSVNEVLARIGNAEIVVPVRETGHGTREVHVRDPAGNLIGFSEAIVSVAGK
jgi:catechol 2,3-dioxygenase-like lactoylglutathione lyase family enzyme